MKDKALKLAEKIIITFFLAIKWLYFAIVTLPRDCYGLFILLIIKRQLKKCEHENITINKAFESLVKKHPNKICFMYEDERWSFKDV
jgi:solute carrier family 27 (fatty acid transporter), member 1/4